MSYINYCLYPSMLNGKFGWGVETSMHNEKELSNGYDRDNIKDVLELIEDYMRWQLAAEIWDDDDCPANLEEYTNEQLEEMFTEAMK